MHRGSRAKVFFESDGVAPGKETVRNPKTYTKITLTNAKRSVKQVVDYCFLGIYTVELFARFFAYGITYIPIPINPSLDDRGIAECAGSVWDCRQSRVQYKSKSSKPGSNTFKKPSTQTEALLSNRSPDCDITFLIS